MQLWELYSDYRGKDFQNGCVNLPTEEETYSTRLTILSEKNTSFKWRRRANPYICEVLVLLSSDANTG